MPISVTTQRSAPGVAAALRAIVRRVVSLEGRTAGEIAIVLAGDAELRDLNRRWRGIDRATDVLSFPYDSVEPSVPSSVLRLGRAVRHARVRPPAISGDLVISMDRMAHQAKRYRVSRGRELARLVVHGTLHLAGHDHHRSGERRSMRAAEEKALRAAAAEVRKLDAVLVKARVDSRTPDSRSG